MQKPPARPAKPPMKNVTPARGAPPKNDKPKEYVPRFPSDRPQKRTAQGGRGNEQVTPDDTKRVAEQTTTTRWDRLPNALEYLRRFIDSKDFPVTGEQADGLVRLLVECLRRYLQHVEVICRNEDKKLTPQHAMKMQNLVHKFKELVGEQVKSPAEKIFDILRFTVVPEVFSENEVTTLTLEGIGRLNIIDDISLTILGDTKDEKEANKAEFYQWLIANEFEDLLTQTVNAQTLAAWGRKQLREKDGVLPPSNLVKINPITRAQITRA